MNTCIITVYNTHNCGSFLQAWSLAKILSDNGHNVNFLKRDLTNTPHTKKEHLIIAIKKALKLKLKAAKVEMKIQKAFDSAQKCFNKININDENLTNIDCFVFGSDTIWNIDKAYFNNKKNIYFGMDIEGKKIAYAPSIGRTDINHFDDKNIKEALNDFSALSSRDINTQIMVKNTIGIDTPIVCDPTLLLNKNDFNALIKDKSPAPDAPIFIYFFDEMDPNNVKKIKEFAKSKGKRIVAMGRDCNWADKVIPHDPYLFLQYFRDSSCVITNTYHGTLFSIIYQKDFICLGKGKAKVEDIMNFVGEGDKLYNPNEDISPAFNQKMNYNNINQCISELKNNSLKFIKDNIK